MSKVAATVVLAYSGGLDTSCILVWLQEQGYDVVAFLANVGQDEDFEAAKEKALQLGAKEVAVLDMKKELVEDFVWPAVQADFIYEGRYLLGTSLARPCIVKGIISVADRVGAGYISHGATGKGNDQVRFELGCLTLRPDIKIISPWKDPGFYKRFQGRQGLFDYAKAKKIPLPVTPKAPWSIDANIIHTSYESGSLEDPSCVPPEGICQMTKDPEKAPDKPEVFTVGFTAGLPTSLTVNEKTVTAPLDIFTEANAIGAKHGIGRIDIVENRYIGLKARNVYETPGLTILRTAHLDLEALCVDKEVRKLKTYLSTCMAEQVYNGYWYSPEVEFTMKCIAESQKGVTGSVTLKAYKGNVYVLSRDSPTSLYNAELVSLDVQGDYEPSDAKGFIAVNAVRLREHRRVQELAKSSIKG